jgi:acetyl esterase/lipase
LRGLFFSFLFLCFLVSPEKIEKKKAPKEKNSPAKHMDVEVATDVLYSETPVRKCDIYRLVQDKTCHGQAPIVILVHGGAWMIGSKQRLANVAESICRSTRSVCIVAEYSLSQLDQIFLQNIIVCDWVLLAVLCILVRKRTMQFLVLCIAVLVTVAILVHVMRRSETKKNAHPAHANDITACINWAVNNANGPLLQANAYKVILLGHSAGAHLSALVVLNKRFLSPDVRRRIIGVVCMSGVYSFWLLQKSVMKYAINRGVFAEHAAGLTYEQYLELENMRKCGCVSCLKQIVRWDNVLDAWPAFHIGEELATQTDPAFLILTSELDLSLIDHALGFTHMLKTKQWRVQHVHFAKTTHFSIRKYWDGKHAHIGNTVSEFILNISS